MRLGPSRRRVVLDVLILEVPGGGQNHGEQPHVYVGKEWTASAFLARGSRAALGSPRRRATLALGRARALPSLPSVLALHHKYASTARGWLAEIGVPSQRRPVPSRRGWRPPAAARAAAPSRRRAAQGCRPALSAAPKACHLRSSAVSGASGRRGLITRSGTGSRSGCTGSPCRWPRGIGR